LKRILIILGVILLAACGSEEQEAADNANDFDEEAFEEEYGDELDELFSNEEIELDGNMTNEVEKIISPDSKFDTFVAEKDEYDTFIFDIKERYISDETDSEGITNIDVMRRDQVDSEDETFDYKFGLMLAKDQGDGQSYLLFVGDVVNNTSKRVQFNHNFDVIMRDIKIEENTYGGFSEYVDLVGAFEPEFDAQGWYAFAIDTDEIPEQLEFTFERAWDENGEAMYDASEGEPELDLEIEFELID